MSVLVAFATAHGSTRRIAATIAEKLEHAGLVVELSPLDAVRSFEAYDAVVVGSAIHDGRWLPGAAERLTRDSDVLRGRLVWLFSTSSVGETSSALGPAVTRAIRLLRRDSAQLVSLRRAVRPRDHRHFAGAIAREHWGLAGHLFLMVMGGSYGDHRDDADIAAWANRIARALLPHEPIGDKATVRV